MSPTRDLFQQELIERLLWFIRLRWFAVVGVLCIVWVAYSWGLILSTLPFLYISLILLALNVAFLLHAKRVSDNPGWATINARAQIISDLIILTLLLHFAGGAENPFLFYFVFHTILASILLERKESYLFAFTAVVLFGSMTLLEYLGAIPHHHLLYRNPFLGLRGPELWRDPVYLSGTFFVFVTTMLISTYLTVSVATKLRERSRRLVGLQEELLRVEKDKWRAIIECMKEGVIFVDTEGKMSFHNASARELKEAAALLECYPASVPETLGQRVELFKSDNPYSFSRTLTVGGRVYESTCSSIKDSEGRHLGVVLVSRDITERKEMERRLMHHEKMTVIGKLAAGIAHELNNPLGVISMFTQMATKKLQQPDLIRDYLNTIMRNTEVCKKVIQSLLSYARTAPVHPRRVNLNDCIEDVLFMCRPLLEKQDIRLRSQLFQGLPGYEGDPDQLRQVFMNLVVNAIQAMERGGELRVASELDHDDGIDALRLVFEDTGVGISKENISRLFEPFFTTKPEGVGTGLGLSTCKNIVEGHGGTIRVESQEGKGSRFTVLFPIKDSPGQCEGVSAGKTANPV